jgi:hypothetical protein
MILASNEKIISGQLFRRSNIDVMKEEATDHAKPWKDQGWKVKIIKRKQVQWGFLYDVWVQAE